MLHDPPQIGTARDRGLSVPTLLNREEKPLARRTIDQIVRNAHGPLKNTGDPNFGVSRDSFSMRDPAMMS